MVKKRLTESERKALFKKYERNEDKNYHTENAIMLIKRFGTSSQLKNARKKLTGIKRRNYVTQTDGRFFRKKGHIHYKKLVTPIKSKLKKGKGR